MDASAQVFWNHHLACSKNFGQQNAEDKLDVFVRVAYAEKVQNARLKLKLPNQHRQVVRHLCILGLWRCVVTLDNQMVWHGSSLPSADFPHPARNPCEHLAKERGTMKEILVISEIEISTKPMGHRQVSGQAGLVERVQGPERELWPATLTLVRVREHSLTTTGY